MSESEKTTDEKRALAKRWLAQAKHAHHLEQAKAWRKEGMEKGGFEDQLDFINSLPEDEKKPIQRDLHVDFERVTTSKDGEIVGRMRHIYYEDATFEKTERGAAAALDFWKTFDRMAEYAVPDSWNSGDTIGKPFMTSAEYLEEVHSMDKKIRRRHVKQQYKTCLRQIQAEKLRRNIPLDEPLCEELQTRPSGFRVIEGGKAELG